MPLLQYAESGTEHFIPYAKKKLRELHDYMIHAGIGAFAKRIDVSDGSAIYLNSLAMGQGVFADKIRITGNVQRAINYAQLMVGASFVSSGAVTGDPALGTAAGVETTTVTFFGPGGTYSVVGTATGAGSVVVYNRWTAQSGLLYFQYGTGSFLSGIAGSISEVFFYDTPECIAAAGLDFSTDELTSAWPTYLAALSFLTGLPSPATRYYSYLTGQYLPNVAGFVPAEGGTVRLTVYASAGNGNSFGMFGPSASRTSVHVLGTASFSYDRASLGYTFRTWTPTEDGVLAILPPANISVANAIVSWPGAATDSFAPTASVTAADAEFSAAVLAAR